jgi:hypothetical protein
MTVMMTMAIAETVVGMATEMATATAMMPPPPPSATLSMKTTGALRGRQLDNAN